MQKQPLLMTSVAFAAVSALLLPRAEGPTLGSIQLNGCVVDIRPLSVSTMAETDIYFNEQQSSVELEVRVPNGVALEATDLTGSTDTSKKVLLKPGATAGSTKTNKVRVTYVTTSLPPKMKVEIFDADTPTTVVRTYDPSPSLGTYNPFATFTEPRVEDFGLVPGTTNKHRIRVFVNYYGIETAFTLQDA